MKMLYLCVVACMKLQESGGIHNPDSGEYAYGIMKIEPNHIGEKAPYYNRLTKEKETISIDKENLSDVKTNIFIGAYNIFV